MARMKQKATLLLLLLVIFSVHTAMGYYDEEGGGAREGDRGWGRGGKREEMGEGREGDRGWGRREETEERGGREGDTGWGRAGGRGDTGWGRGGEAEERGGGREGDRGWGRREETEERGGEREGDAGWGRAGGKGDAGWGRGGETEERGGGGGDGGWGRRVEGEGAGEDAFLLRDSKQVVSTEAGEMRVVKGFGGRGIDNPIHIGFINMEPKTLFLPQYIDSNLILFVRRGEVKIGGIYKDRLVERQLRIGDIYRIPAGFAFYLLNTGEGQRLQIICSIDRFESKGQRSYQSESTGQGPFQSFFIGGGTNPRSVLEGFDHKILETAFNISSSELEDIMVRQQGGPIVFVPDAHQPGKWESFMKLKELEMIGGLMGVEGEDDDEDEDEGLVQEKEEEKEEKAWTWRKLLKSFIGVQESKDEDKKSKVRSPDAYNLYDGTPDFRNSYGWSIAVDKHDYPPLKKSNVGVYLVNLNGGSMMAPHVNTRATEYGIVLSGEGSLQVVYPDGTSAMNAKLREGDLFVVPRYFPFCQIASRNGPLEFFGFATSARKNRPQFLAGANSILQAMRGPELAMTFDMSEKKLGKLIGSQRESVILPTVPTLPGKEEEKKRGEGKEQQQEEERQEQGKKRGEEERETEREARGAGKGEEVRSLGASGTIW